MSKISVIEFMFFCDFNIEFLFVTKIFLVFVCVIVCDMIVLGGYI